MKLSYLFIICLLPLSLSAMLIKLPDEATINELALKSGLGEHFIEHTKIANQLANKEYQPEFVVFTILDLGESYLDYIKQTDEVRENINLMGKIYLKFESILARKLLAKYPEEIARLEKEKILQ